MSNPTRIGQEAPDLKTPSSPSRITPTRAIDDAEKQMTKPPEPKYPYAVDDDGVARVGCVAVDPGQHNKATELQLSGPRRRHLRDAVARRRRHLNVCAHAC